MANRRVGFGQVFYPSNQKVAPHGEQFIQFRLETVEATRWVVAAYIKTTPHVMQVILDRLAPLEGVQAFWPNGSVMKPNYP